MLIDLIVGLIVIGLILWLIEKLPIDAAMVQIIRVVVIVAVIIYLLYFLAGFMPSGNFPRVH